MKTKTLAYCILLSFAFVFQACSIFDPGGDPPTSAPKPDCLFTMDSISEGVSIDRIHSLQIQAQNGASISADRKFGSGSLNLSNPDQTDLQNRQAAVSVGSSEHYDICDVWTIAFWWKPSRVDYERGFTTILGGYKNGSNYDAGGWVFNHMNDYNGSGTAQYSMQQWLPGMAQWMYLEWENHTPAIGEWEHVTIVKANSHLELYINGEIQGKTWSTAPTGYPASSNSNLIVGTDLLDDAATPGLIDDVAIYTHRALEANEILDLMAHRIIL